MKNNFFKFLRQLTVLVGCLLLFSSLQARADQSSDARLLASQCAQCHGTTGNTLGDFDSIAGESYRELLSELREMKNDNDNKIMHKQVQGYTDLQLQLIAGVYADTSVDPKNNDKKKDEENKRGREDQKNEDEDDEDDEDED